MCVRLLFCVIPIYNIQLISSFLSLRQINQLEKDKDVISQSQAISVLEKSPQLTFAVTNALNNFLNDTKVFQHVS
jgi:hypothetical protein